MSSSMEASLSELASAESAAPWDERHRHAAPGGGGGPSDEPALIVAAAVRPIAPSPSLASGSVAASEPPEGNPEDDAAGGDDVRRGCFLEYRRPCLAFREGAGPVASGSVSEGLDGIHVGEEDRVWALVSVIGTEPIHEWARTGKWDAGDFLATIPGMFQAGGPVAKTFGGTLRCPAPPGLPAGKT